MNKNIMLIWLSLILFAGTISLTAQDVPIPPEPEEPVKVPGLFDRYLNLSQEDENEYLKNIPSKLKEHLKIIKEQDKNRYYDLLRDYYFRNMRYPMMRKIEKEMVATEKEMLEYEIIVESLATKYKRATGTDKSKIKSDLEKNLTYLFDLKEKQREYEVRELESRLDELKKKMAVRKSNRSTIIKRRLEELLGVDEYLEWE